MHFPFPSAFCRFVAARNRAIRSRKAPGKVWSLDCDSCFSKKVILATITLDLFAVLLGGATALLPIFADQILHCGPIGLGWMRAAPAVGAFVMALLVAYLPPMKQAGKALLWCVTGFGIATILFGLSKALWLSLGLLFLVGAFDSVSVIIRGSIVQLVTPDEMRGRVSAVNNIFLSAHRMNLARSNRD